jgi:hypothetical protein
MILITAHLGAHEFESGTRTRRVDTSEIQSHLIWNLTLGLALGRKFSEWTHRKIVIGTTYGCFLAVLAAPQSEPGLTRSG